MRIKARAWMTGTRVIWHSDEDGDYTETHGWTDDGFNAGTLVESRNYVSPVGEWDSSDEYDTDEYPTVEAWGQAMLERHLGAWEGEDGTYYGVDEVLNRDTLENGGSLTLALHLERWAGTTANGTAGVWVPVSV